MDDVRRAVSMELKKAGDFIYIVGSTHCELGGSAYFKTRGIIGNSVPGVDPQQSQRLMAGLSMAMGKAMVRACHACSEGGIGVAVDANILIFGRMKEGIRGGRSLGAAIDAGFDRAWTSIRDSNLSTLLTCIILFWFGSNFGASVVKGFAITLFIGVATSMFTAITVTRTFIRFVFDLAGESLRDKHWLLGI